MRNYSYNHPIPGLERVRKMTKIEISITGIGEIRQITINSGATVEDVLKRLELNVSAQIVLRGKTPIPTDEIVMEGDELRVIETFSGG